MRISRLLRRAPLAISWLALAAACATEPERRVPLEVRADGEAATDEEGGWNRAGFRLIEGRELGGGVWRRLEDRAGRILDLPAPPARVVSQTLASDEVLLELLPGDRLIAVSALALDPRYSLAVEAAARVPETVVHDTERLLSLRADLIVAASYTTPETLRQLAHAGAPVLRLRRFDSVAAIRDNVRSLGFAVGEDEAAAALIAEMDRRIEAERRRVRKALESSALEDAPPAAGSGSAPAHRPRDPPLRVLSWDDAVAPGAGTIFDDLVRLLGAENPVSAAGLHGWPRVGVEQILVWDPDAIFVSAPPGEELAVRHRLLGDPRLSLTTAAKRGRIHVIDAALFSTVSHHVAGLAEAIGARLAPPDSAAEPATVPQ
ncbi:MAG TPA: ABC transporter substrate-binding protein [Thermoanaerobaculia bacterium]|nr:ABC transporter substrate-binding protein [Thermoanaerobaculia bacterium]